MTHRDRKWLDTAREAPCCLQIGECNGGGMGQIVACHSDLLEDGRGVGHKSHDALTVPGCVYCHALFTRKNLGREEYERVHAKALKRYLVWAFENRRLMVA